MRLWEGLAGGKTRFVTTVTDRDALLQVLERMIWLRARNARAAKRRRTVREGDTAAGEESLIACLPDTRPDNDPALAMIVNLTEEEAEEQLRRSSKSEKQARDDMVSTLTVFGRISSELLGTLSLVFVLAIDS